MSETPAEPDFDADPGLAPDPEHEVHENPPERSGRAQQSGR
ncbi:hypothetical protein [Aeromicrobium sp. P5_D10]